MYTDLSQTIAPSEAIVYWYYLCVESLGMEKKWSQKQASLFLVF